MKAVTLRITEDSEKACKRIQKKSRFKQSDVLRLAIERGLPLVETAFEGILGKPAGAAK